MDIRQFPDGNFRYRWLHYSVKIAHQVLKNIAMKVCSMGARASPLTALFWWISRRRCAGWL